MKTKKLIVTITEEKMKGGGVRTLTKFKGDESLLPSFYGNAFEQAAYLLKHKEKSLFCKLFGL